MSKVTFTQQFAASPETLWQHVGQPENLATWHPAIESSQVSSDGRSRTCVLADGATINEEITAHDDADRRYTYRITGGPLPVENYVSTLSVAESDSGSSVTWEGDFDVAPGAPAAEVEEMIRGVYAAGLGALAAETTKARLGCLVFYVGYRNPASIAKAASEGIPGL